jgi:hypothetical protein
MTKESVAGHGNANAEREREREARPNSCMYVLPFFSLLLSKKK